MILAITTVVIIVLHTDVVDKFHPSLSHISVLTLFQVNTTMKVLVYIFCAGVVLCVLWHLVMLTCGWKQFIRYTKKGDTSTDEGGVWEDIRAGSTRVKKGGGVYQEQMRIWVCAGRWAQHRPEVAQRQ